MRVVVELYIINIKLPQMCIKRNFEEGKHETF